MTTSAARDPSLPYQASPRALARATLGAAVAAAAILTLFVLPAEWAIDPTGIGRALGLTRMARVAESEEPETPAAAPQLAAAVQIGPQLKETIETITPWRTDEKTLTLAPHSGVEIKAHMVRGDRFVFHWSATGPVRMDMHGERGPAKDGEFTTYWKQKDLSAAQGSFTAAYDGIHGWYWRNGSDAPVTIKLQTTGFYKDLFEPPAS